MFTPWNAKHIPLGPFSISLGLYARSFTHIWEVSFTCKGGWNGSAILKEGIP
jgi:hypothetical protein